MHKNESIRVAVAGASGYAGGELLKYLHGHPKVEVVATTAFQQAGSEVGELFPNLAHLPGSTLEETDWAIFGSRDGAEVVFLCLPHGLSQQPVKKLLSQGIKVIDLGADFRFSAPALYQQTYGAEHLYPELCEQAVYGLCEMHKDAIKGASLVANPGCYPTATLLALLPLVENKLLGPTVIVDAKSGVSGAGRGLKFGTLFCEVNETLTPYSLGVHRHQPEIEQFVGAPVVFAPHLVPMSRGILVTVYVAHQPADLLALYRERYAPEPFVTVLEKGLPTTKAVSGTNRCHLAIRPSGQEGLSIVVAAIDNLGKGAAGAAVQNMNLLFDLPETTGLEAVGSFP